MKIINSKELARIDFNYEEIVNTIMEGILKHNSRGSREFEIHIYIIRNYLKITIVFLYLRILKN